MILQVGRSQSGVDNPLLEYLKSLDSAALQELTVCDDDVLESVNTFIQRLLGRPAFSVY